MARVTVRILQGDCRNVLKTLAGGIVQCVVTSPPYFGLRDYGVDGQMGLEPTPAAFVAELVAVFREIRRVLRDDGVCWLNLGDSFAGSWGARGRGEGTNAPRADLVEKHGTDAPARNGFASLGIKPKDLIGIPWRVAFALQDDGWYLRRDVIWAKPNPMPESCTDRPTTAHEYLFLLTKKPQYFYDAEAVKEPTVGQTPGDLDGGPQRARDGTNANCGRNFRQKGNAKAFRGGGAYTQGQSFDNDATIDRESHGNQPNAGTRNLRSVWTIATTPYGDTHFATFPPKLAETCIAAGTSEKGACSACGAPWARVVERTSMVIDRSKRTHSRGRTRPSGTMVSPPTATTAGWEATCDCPAAALAPCLVLDPFGGSGTVGMVSDRMQRDAVLIELKPGYVVMARNRIVDDAGLFAEVAD